MMKQFSIDDGVCFALGKDGTLYLLQSFPGGDVHHRIDKAGLLLWLGASVSKDDAERAALKIGENVTLGDLVGGARKLWDKAGR